MVSENPLPEALGHCLKDGVFCPAEELGKRRMMQQVLKDECTGATALHLSLSPVLLQEANPRRPSVWVPLILYMNRLASWLLMSVCEKIPGASNMYLPITSIQ